ncbi:hypothetical protein V6N13_099983 [Hibiscus sabdariffa]
MVSFLSQQSVEDVTNAFDVLVPDTGRTLKRLCEEDRPYAENEEATRHRTHAQNSQSENLQANVGTPRRRRPPLQDMSRRSRFAGQSQRENYHSGRQQHSQFNRYRNRPIGNTHEDINRERTHMDFNTIIS